VPVPAARIIGLKGVLKVSPILTAALAGIVVFCAIVFIALMRAKKNAQEQEPERRGDRRKEPRIPINSEFDLFWQDSDATRRSARARGIEVSEHGASMRSPRPIQCNSVIQVRGCQVEFEGRATVRRCTRKGLSYIVGLQVENSQFQRMGLRA